MVILHTESFTLEKDEPCAFLSLIWFLDHTKNKSTNGAEAHMFEKVTLWVCDCSPYAFLEANHFSESSYDKFKNIYIYISRMKMIQGT